MVDGARHIRDLSLVLAGALTGCRSGESAGRVWGSLRCGWGSAFSGAARVESESGAHLEELWRLCCADLDSCQSLGVRPGGCSGLGD